MPFTRRDGIELHYETSGTGETVAFVNDVGYGAWMWGWQHPRLARGYEVLVWDLRGTGRSDAPPGPYDIETLAADFEAVLAAAGVDRAHVVGAGLGGMVALEHAGFSGRTRTLTILGSATDGDAINETALAELFPRSGGYDSLRQSLEGALSPEFREARPGLVDQICEWRAKEDASFPAVQAQMAAAVSYEGSDLYEIDQPALIAHGLEDPVVSPKAGRRLAESLPAGTFQAVEGRHLCFVEHARAVTDRLLAHLDEHKLTE